MVMLLWASKFASAKIECITSKWASKHLWGVLFILLLAMSVLPGIMLLCSHDRSRSEFAGKSGIRSQQFNTKLMKRLTNTAAIHPTKL